MASWAAGRLQDPGYKRFILAGLAWDWLCTQLEPYLERMIQDLHADLIRNGHTKPICHVNTSTYKQVKACPQMSCGSSVRFLDRLHSNGSVHLGWKNSVIELWETHTWSLALMFMNQGQNPGTNTGPDKTDISGVLNLLIHCNQFRVNRVQVEKIQQYRNQLIHHTPTFKVDEADFKDIIDVIEKLLFDPCVAGYVNGNEVKQYLDNVKKMKLDVTFHDEITVLKQLLCKIDEGQAQHWATFLVKHDDLAKAMTESIDKQDDLKKVMTDKQDELKMVMTDKQDDLKKVVTDKQDELKKVMTDKQDDLKKVMTDTQDELKKVMTYKQDELKNVINDKQEDLEKVMTDKQDELKMVMTDEQDELKKVIADTQDELKKAMTDKQDELKNVLTDEQDELKKVIADTQDELKKVMTDKQDELKNVMTDKQEDLTNVISESIHRQDEFQKVVVETLQTITTQNRTQIFQAANEDGNIDQVELDDNIAGCSHQKAGLTERRKEPDVMREEVNPQEITNIAQNTDAGPVYDLQRELIKCYSRPDYTNLNPLVDDDTFSIFIESVYVEVSLEQREIKPIWGKRGLEDLMRQKGTPVKNASDMIPPPGDQRVLLTGFVGSGKTSLCLHWIHDWITRLQDKSKMSNNNNSNIHLYDLVVFLRARALERNMIQSLMNVLQGELEFIETRQNIVHAALAANPSTLIVIDGYDEANKCQKNIVDDILSHRKHANASVLITSRPNFFSGKIQKWYDNIGFNKEQQKSFIKLFKATLLDNNMKCDNFDQFEEEFESHKNASNVFTSPMMAMTSCTMVAAGEKVNFDSRVQNYQQLTDFLVKRAIHKSEGQLTPDQLTQAMPAFIEATYNHMLKKKNFQFSRNELLGYNIPGDTLDNIIVQLGYMSVTKYICRSSTDTAYTFVHKSWAEFTAAKYVISLPSAERCTAVCQLFKSGPANVEVLRFAFGLCSKDNNQTIVFSYALGLCCRRHKDETMVLMFRSIVGVVIDDLDTEDETVRDEMETIRAAYDAHYNDDIHPGSAYLLLLLADVDPRLLPAALLWELSRVCAAVRRAEIEAATVGERVEGEIDVSLTDQRSACALFTSQLLTAHSTHSSLHTVRQVRVRCEADSPHSAVTRLPATLAACAPRMTALTQVLVWYLASATQLGEVCRGLAASGLRCLTNLKLTGCSDLSNVAGGDLGPVVQVIKTAAQLRNLNLTYIHAGEEGQLSALCAAVMEATPQLTHLELDQCSVSAQQYSAILLPALHRRLTARGARMQEVMLVREEKDGGSAREWEELRRALRKVARSVDVEKY